jgi:very-short-patch-repair endonuclease
VDVVEAVTRFGGVAETRRLVDLTSRRRVATAVRAGRIVREAPGRYALPTAEEARRAAHRLSGVVTGPSAAAAHGWETKVPPPRPDVTVPAKRRVSPDRRRGVDLHWRDIDSDDVWNGILRAGPTVIDCARRLPFDEALAIADSALRHGNVTPQGLLALARQVPTTGRRQCLRVAHEASELAANPFESVLRSISLDVPGLDLRPQVVVEQDGWIGRPDLVDVERRIVVEADSFEFHGHRKALKRDCERYNALVIRGWVVLRFSWEHVMHDPHYVRACLVAIASARTARQVTPAVGRRIPA